MQLLQLGGDARTIFISGAGAVAVFAVTAWFVWIVTAGFAAFPQKNDASGFGSSVRAHIIERLERPLYVWHDTVAGSWFTEEYGLLFRMFTAGRHWYVAVELAVGLACGIIGGIDPRKGCTSQRAALVAVAAVELSLLLLLWPSNTRLRSVVMLTNSAALLVSSSLVLANNGAANTVTIAGVAVVDRVVLIVLAVQFASWWPKRLLLPFSDLPASPLPSVYAMQNANQSLVTLINLICFSRTNTNVAFHVED
jgi:hypothetical protein